MGRMNCQECRRWWSPYLDSELDATKTFEISEHLRVCECCRTRFDREAEIDALTRERLALGEKMPDAMWAAIRHDVCNPQPRVFRLFGWPLAMAASIALIFVAGFMLSRDGNPPVAGPGAVANAGGPTRSVVELLREASPQLAAFELTPVGDVEERLSQLARDMFGVSVSLSMERSMGHDVRIVDVGMRTDETGAQYLELRVNCCGKPALVAMSRRQDRPIVREIKEVCDRCAGSDDAPASVIDGVAVQTVERDGVIIAAAAGADPQHKHVEALLASVTVTHL